VSAYANTQNESSFGNIKITDLNISGPPQKASSKLLQLSKANHDSTGTNDD